MIEALRSRGYPAPKIELAVQLEDAVVLVQQLLPGAKIDSMSGNLLQKAVALNGLQAGVFAGRPEMRPIRLHLLGNGPGFCLHEPLCQYSKRTARLERWIRDMGAEYPLQLEGDDAVHFDFHPGNLLAEADEVTGVVDWDGAGRSTIRSGDPTLWAAAQYSRA